MISRGEVDKALNELRQGFQADGADLTIESLTESEVTIRLTGTDETCWECIVAPDQLHMVVDSVLRSTVSGVETIAVVDPRVKTG